MLGDGPELKAVTTTQCVVSAERLMATSETSLKSLLRSVGQAAGAAVWLALAGNDQIPSDLTYICHPLNSPWPYHPVYTLHNRHPTCQCGGSMFDSTGHIHHDVLRATRFCSVLQTAPLLTGSISGAECRACLSVLLDLTCSNCVYFLCYFCASTMG